MEELKLRAPAKLNLHLEVVNNEHKSWNPSLLFFTTSRCKLSFAGALIFNSSIFF